MPSTLPVLTGAKKTKRFGTERLVLPKDEELQEQIRREKEARNIEMQAAREAREMAAQIKAQERWQARQEAPAGMPDPIRPMQSAPLPVLRPTQPMPQVAPRPVDTRPTGGQIAMAPIQMAKAVQAPEQVTTPRDALGFTAEDYNAFPEGNGRQFTSEYTNPRFGGIFSRYGKGKETSVDEAAKSRLSNYAQKNVLTKEEGEDFKNLAFSVAKEIEGKIANRTVTDEDIALMNEIDAIRNKARIESGTMTMENPDGSFTVESTAKPMTSALETAGKAFNDAMLRLPMLLGRQAMDEDTQAALDAVLADREQEKSAHPVANMAGTMGANMLMYGGINSLAEGAGLTGQLASRLGGTARAERIARQMVGLGPDLLVDTLPTVVQNAQSGMPVSEQLKEAGKNVLVNAGFNAGAEYAPMLLKALSNNPAASQIAKNADDITDATRNKAVRVGRITEIQNPYTSGPVPRMVDGFTPSRVAISDEAYTNAIKNLETAQTSEGSVASSIRKVYTKLFRDRGGQHKVLVDGASYEGGDYFVNVSKRSVEKVASDGVLNAEKLAVLDDLDTVIKNSEYVGSGDYVPHHPQQGPSNVIRYDYLETPVNVNGKDYTVGFDVAVYKDKNNYRTHRVVEEINLKETGSVPSQDTSADLGTIPRPSRGAPTLSGSSASNIADTAAPVNDYAGELALLEQARDTDRALEAQGIPILQQAERAAEPVPSLRQATEQTADALKATPEPVVEQAEEVAEQLAKGPSQNLNTRYEEFLGNFFKDPTEKDRPIAEALSGFEKALKAGDVDGMNAVKEAAKGTAWENDISDIIAGVKYGDDALTTEATRMRRILPEADYDRYADTIHELHRNEEQLNAALNEAFEGRMDPVDAFEYVQNSQRSYDKIQKYLARKSKREAELVGVQYETGAKNAHQKWAAKLKQRRDRLKAISNQTESQIEELRHIENALLYDKAQKDVYKEGQKAWDGYTALFDEDSDAATAAAKEWRKRHPRAPRSMALEMEQPTLEATPEEMARIRARNAAGNETANMDELGRGGEPSYEAMDMAYRQMVKDGELKAGKDLSTEETMNVLERARQIDYDNGDFREAPEFTNGKPYYETQGINEKRYFGEAEIPAGRKERGFAQSMRTEGKIPDEIRRNLTENPITYKGITNAETAKRITDVWQETSGTFDEAEKTLAKLIKENDPGSALYAKNLMTAYSEAGQSENAMKVMEQISEAMTVRGRFTQAAILALAKDDPMTALKYAQRSIDEMNVKGAKEFKRKWKDFFLLPKEVEAFAEIKPGDQKALENLFDQIGRRIGAEYPVKMIDKIMEWRRLGFLFNTRTQIRNFGANIPTRAMRYASDRVEAIGQNVAKLIAPDFEITQSVGPIGQKYRKLGEKVWDSDIVKGLIKDSDNKYSQIPNLKSKVIRDKQTYKGTRIEKWINRMTDGGIEKLNRKLFGKEHVQSVLETYRNATYKLLDLGDSPFVRGNFIDRIGSYMKAQGIENAADVPDDAIQLAWEEAMKATYKDDSAIAQMVTGFKKDLQKLPIVGKVISEQALPFPRTPGNIAQRMLDYSPVGAGKGIADIVSGSGRVAKIIDGVDKADYKQVSKGIEELAKGLTGSGMAVLGIALYNSGILTGGYSDDPAQKAHQQQTGFKEYSLHVGDKYYTIDWLQPIAQAVMSGAIIAEAIEASDEIDDRILNDLGEQNQIIRKATGIWNTTKKIVGRSVNSWFNASPMQSFSELLGEQNTYNSNAGISERLGSSLLQDLPTSFIPSQMGAIARGTGQYQRDTFDKTSPLGTVINQAKAKIPGLESTLPIRYDTWGRPMTYGDNAAETMISQNIVPGQVGREQLSDIEKEVNRLYEATGNTDVFAPKAAYYFGSTKLTNAEHSELQKIQGEMNTLFANALFSSDEYTKLDDVDKAAELNYLYKFSGALAKNRMFGQTISNEYSKAARIYNESNNDVAGINNVLMFRKLKNEAGSTKEDIAAYLDATGMSTAEKEKWFGYLSTAKNNPYSETATAGAKKEQEETEKVPVLNQAKATTRYTNWAEGEPAQQTQASGNIPVLNFDIASSDSYGRFQKVPGINTSTDNYATIYGGMDADSNGRLKKAEIMDYLDASSYSDKQKKALFDAYKTKRMKNPY